MVPTIITKEALAILENNLVMGKLVNREYDDRFATSGAPKIGTTLTIRKPNRFTVSTGAALSIQDITEPSVVLTVATQDHVDTNFTTSELTLSIDNFSDRILKPKVAALANNIDYALMGLYKDVYNVVGTAGTTPSTAAAILGVGQRLNDEAAPFDDSRALVVNPAANASLVDGLKGLFNSVDVIKDQYESGNMGKALGFKFSMAQNIRSHTTGQRGGTPLVNGTTTSGAVTLVTDGWTASAATRVKQGDVFTLASVNAVNPQTRVSTGVLRQFVALADGVSDGSGNMTISVSPAITSSGAYQTVDALPADNAALTFVGTLSTAYPQNLGFLKDAFTLATVDLEDVSKFGAWGNRQNYKGISLRTSRQYRIGTDDVPCRIDVLYGVKTIYPEMACRLIG